MSKQRSTLYSIRQCRFDSVAKNGNVVEAAGNKVASCFENVAGVDREGSYSWLAEGPEGKGKGRILIWRSLRDDRTSALYNLGSGS